MIINLRWAVKCHLSMKTVYVWSNKMPRYLMISDGLRISVLLQMNDTLPYCPSINNCRRKCSPSKSRAVLSLTARWILDTTQTALQLFKYCQHKNTRMQVADVQCGLHQLMLSPSISIPNGQQFLPLDEAIASRAVIVIVHTRVGGNAFGAN